MPGDVFEISDPKLHVFPCDAVLLSGDCIANESMLTGIIRIHLFYLFENFVIIYIVCMMLQIY